MSLSLKYLTAAIFILAAIPRANISVGPVPVYLIDVCLVGAIYYGGLQRLPIYGKAPLGGLVLAILSFALLSEALTGAMMGAYIEAAYMGGRMCLAVSLFFLLNNIVRTEAELVPILKAATVGMLFTAFLMAMTSLPGTRGLVSWLFGYDFLSPVGESFFEATANLNRGTRGQSLVGYNIISAWFVCLLWPMALALFRSPYAVGIWRNIALAGVALAPFGIIFSYSRGALLGMFLLIAALLFFGEGRLKAQIAVAIAVVVSVIGFFGWDSDLFYFERIERRTQASLENPFGNEMESERFRSYIDPFIVVSENPASMLGGSGLGGGRARQRGYNVGGGTIFSADIGRNIADHSVFSKGTLIYGMFAAFCYLGLWFGALSKSYREARYSAATGSQTRYFTQLAFASAFAISAWVAFDKGIIMQPRGAMMFFFVVALAGVCANLRISETEAVEGRESSDQSNAENKHEDPVAALYR